MGLAHTNSAYAARVEAAARVDSSGAQAAHLQAEQICECCLAVPVPVQLLRLAPAPLGALHPRPPHAAPAAQEEQVHLRRRQGGGSATSWLVLQTWLRRQSPCAQSSAASNLGGSPAATPQNPLTCTDFSLPDRPPSPESISSVAHAPGWSAVRPHLRRRAGQQLNGSSQLGAGTRPLPVAAATRAFRPCTPQPAHFCAT